MDAYSPCPCRFPAETAAQTQETGASPANRQGRMDAPKPLRFRRCRRLIPPLLSLALCAALAGCGARTPAQRIVGIWQGRMTAGSVTVPARWELHADGTQSVALTLPQGLLTAEGTYLLHDGTLTRRTTSRVVVLNGEKKAMPLINPMETTYQCQVTEDTLTLTQPDTQETITLTREK